MDYKIKQHSEKGKLSQTSGQTAKSECTKLTLYIRMTTLLILLG